jgi:cytochrome c-type biogenesis protein CcmH
MPVFWYSAGILTTLAALVMILPWLRSMPRLSSVPTVPWQASVAAAVIAAAIFGSYRWLGHPDVASPPATRSASDSAPGTNDTATGAFGSAAKVFSNAAGESGTTATPETKAGAGSMDSAITSLEARLAKGGGSADDWELLAKSFEFLGRPADAVKARAHQLPRLADPNAAGDAAASPMASAGAATTAPGTAAASGAAVSGSGTAVSGEVSLAPALSAKATAGETLFIVAKSVDAPGIPVAVFRGSVGSWPLKFTLDDSQSMMPGRNLSSAGRVTIEARISHKGQPLPAAGDLQGSTGVINPADHRPLKILIDHVVT